MVIVISKESFDFVFIYWFSSFLDYLTVETLLCASMNFYAFESKNLHHRSMDASHLEHIQKKISLVTFILNSED